MLILTRGSGEKRMIGIREEILEEVWRHLPSLREGVSRRRGFGVVFLGVGFGTRRVYSSDG